MAPISTQKSKKCAFYRGAGKMGKGRNEHRDSDHNPLLAISKRGVGLNRSGQERAKQSPKIKWKRNMLECQDAKVPGIKCVSYKNYPLQISHPLILVHIKGREGESWGAWRNENITGVCRGAAQICGGFSKLPPPMRRGRTGNYDNFRICGFQLQEFPVVKLS